MFDEWKGKSLAIKKRSNVKIGYLFTPIPNDVLEAKMRVRLSGDGNRIWDCICRKTYGWHYPTAMIKGKEFVEKTGICSTQSVYRAIKRLRNKNMIIKVKTEGGTEYGIQNDFRKWKGVAKLRHCDSSNDNKIVTEMIPDDNNNDTTKSSKPKSANYFPNSKERFKEKKEIKKKCNTNTLQLGLKDNHPTPPEIHLEKYTIEDLKKMLSMEKLPKKYKPLIREELKRR